MEWNGRVSVSSGNFALPRAHRLV